MRNGVIIDDRDNVVVAIYPLHAGDEVTYALPGGESGHVVANQDVPLFHKVARQDIKAGQAVVKYGEFIGQATCDIKAGDHVHVHNCASSDALKDAVDVDADVQSEAARPSAPVACTRTFMGYRRSDGRVGIRNHVLILPTSICASDTTERIARAVEGCVTFHNQNGCSQVDADQQLTVDTLAGTLLPTQIFILCWQCRWAAKAAKTTWLSTRFVNVRTSESRRSSSSKWADRSKLSRRARGSRGELVREASLEVRTECGIDELIFGTNCGGSDTSSGLGSNPLIGEVSDWMVSQGATTVLCETPELFGGEHILARRAATKEIGDQLLKIVYDYEAYVQKFGAEMREGNPSPGNMAGGLTTLEEKSLGCIHKAGHSTINAVYPYAAQLDAHKGLVVMDTPGNDPSSVGGIIAGGCQLVVFSTGLGTPNG